MPSCLGHAAPVIALASAFWTPAAPKRLWAAGILAGMAPDLDVIAFSLGIPYAHPLGHRGLSHSLPFAAAFAAMLTFALFPRAVPSVSRTRAFAFLFLATASHGVLDSFTNGGLGIALLSPFDGTRYFAPFRPIEVSPLSLTAFLSSRGLAVLESELRWLWLPFLSLAVLLAGIRRVRGPRTRRL
jgi:inner membrane protein